MHLDQYDASEAFEAPAQTPARVRVPRTSPWREVLRRHREERSRVLPLPLAFAAISFPFLCAWAVGAEGAGEAARRGPAPRSAALDVLDREHRATAPGEAYVDVHGAAAGWERELLARQGYVAPR